MARPLRIHVPGRAYHIFARGDNKGRIFRDDDDRERFLWLFQRSLERFAIECLAYCLMGTHYHLLVIPYEHSVSRLMHHVNSCYCRLFNKKHGRVGHVLQGRFGSKIIDDDDYMMTALRYIALNPVADKLVKHPEQWRWSSCAATMGLVPVPPFLNVERVWSALNRADPSEAQARYITHVGAAAGAEELRQALLFGGELLAKQVAPLLVPHRDTIDYTYAQRFATRPALAQIFAGREAGEPARAAAADAFHGHAYTHTEIGRHVGKHPSTVCRWIQSVGRTARGDKVVIQATDPDESAAYAQFKL